MFNPTDWYWILGGEGPHVDEGGNYTGDETRVFSSARNHYFPSDDATYLAWKHTGLTEQHTDLTTRIDTEANLTTVLAEYGITPDFS